MKYDEIRKEMYEKYHDAFQKLYVSELKDDINALNARIKDLENELLDQENEMIDLEEELMKAYKKIKELEAANKPKSAPRKWKCPIDYPGCTKNCGSYGCGN
jgi:hypothetical protein